MAQRRPVSTRPVERFEDADFELEQSKVQLGAVLGKGAFSTVYKAKYEGVDIAVKVQSVVDAELERYVRNELAILRRCNHSGLVSFVGACRIDEDTYYVATEYCRGGDLRRLLGSGRAIAWHQRAQILAGVAEALAYLHDRDVLHRDVKTENVLLDEALTPKLCDLGFARTVDLRKGPSGRPMTMLGTDEFMSPELLFGMEYNDRADVFGLGVVVAETMTRKPPGKRSGFLQRHPANGFALEEADAREIEHGHGAPESLAHLCLRMLATESAERPSARECADWLEELVRELSADAPPPLRMTEAEMLKDVERDMARREAEAKDKAETQDEDDISAIVPGTGTRMGVDILKRELQQAVMRAREFEPPGDDDDDDDDGAGEEEERHGARAAAAAASTGKGKSAAAALSSSAAKPSAKGASSLTRAATASSAANARAAQRAAAGPPSKSSPRLLAGQPGMRAANRRSQLYHAMSGYLLKRGGRIRTWRSRFVVVTSEGLVYFKSKEDFLNAPQDMKGSIPFRDMVKPPRQMGVADTVGFLVARRSNAFRVMTQQRPRFFQTSDQRLSEKWVRAINLAYSTWFLNNRDRLAGAGAGGAGGATGGAGGSGKLASPSGKR